MAAALGLAPGAAQGSGVVSDCSEAALRGAVAGGGKVSFGCDGTIVLSQSLVISNSVFLDGTGRQVTISGGNAVRIFEVRPQTTLDLLRLTLADGLSRGATGAVAAAGATVGTTGGTGEGGAVLVSNAVLQAVECRFLSNRAVGGVGGPRADGFIDAPGTGGIGRGGAIASLGGTIRLERCQLFSNRATGGTGGYSTSGSSSGGPSFGGALYAVGGLVECRETFWSNNVALGGRGYRLGLLHISAAGQGGAIYNNGAATVESSRFVTNSAIAEFVGPGMGGAILQASGRLALATCSLNENRALGGAARRVGSPLGIASGPGLGGALHVAAGEAAIVGTTFAGNAAVGGPTAPSGTGLAQGGGIFSAAGVSVTLTNVTFHGNEAIGGRGDGAPSGSGEGGGLYNTAGASAAIVQATFARNAARPGPGGGQFNGPGRGGAIASAGGTVLLVNSLLGDSLSGSNWFGAGLVEGGPNLSSDLSAPLTAPGSLVNVDPRLGPLAVYSGPTATVALQAGSPAIDAASAGSCQPTDQRGRPRPFGAACDLGAFESSEPYFILGRITGHLPPAGAPGGAIDIASASGAAAVGPDGAYAAAGFLPGSHLLTPRSADAVFLPGSRTVTVLADMSGIDFHSYRTNALTMERGPAGRVRGVFAGEPGATYHVLSATQPFGWSPVATNVMPAGGLFEFLPAGSATEPQRYFRVVRP